MGDNSNQIAWFAGLFEGEACVATNKGDDRYWRILISMTDLDVLERAQAVMGAGTIQPLRKRQPHHKDAWILAIHKRGDVIRVLKAVQPYLGIRRSAKVDQALECLCRYGANG